MPVRTFSQLFGVGIQQLQRPRPDTGEPGLIHIGELPLDSCGSHCVTIVYLAFIRRRQKLPQQAQIVRIMQLHQLCPVFQLCVGDVREPLQIHRVLRLVLQQRNQKTLAFKIVRLLDAADGAVLARSPAACTGLAEAQVVHPASEHEALENIDGIVRRSAGQLHPIGGGDGVLPDIGAVIPLCFSEQRMVALRFKQRLKPLFQRIFIGIRQFQKGPQSRQQLVCRLLLRKSAVEGIPNIHLIQPQDPVKRLRHVIGTVFPVFKNRDIGREDVLILLVLPHIGNGAPEIAGYEKIPDLIAHWFSFLSITSSW